MYDGLSVLVTGGAGFIGSHLVERLARECPRRLSVVDNFFLGTRLNLQEASILFPSLSCYDANATDFARMEQIFKIEQPAIVFNLSTIPLPASLERPEFAIREIVNLAAVMCELGRRGLYERLVHCSSSEAYGTATYVPMDEMHPLAALTPYAAGKAAADLVVRSYCETFGLMATIVRPFNTYGPRQNARSYAGIIPITIRRIYNGEPPVIYGTGEQTRDYTFVSDIVHGMVLAGQEANGNGDVINLGSGKEVQIRHLVESIAGLLGYEGDIIHAPPRPGDVLRHCASIERARAALAFAPRVSLSDGLSRTVAWYRERVGLAS